MLTQLPKFGHKAGDAFAIQGEWYLASTFSVSTQEYMSFSISCFLNTAGKDWQKRLGPDEWKKNVVCHMHTSAIILEAGYLYGHMLVIRGTV